MRWTELALIPAVVAGLLTGCAVPPPQSTPAASPQASLDGEVGAAMRAVSQTLASAKALTVNMTILREGRLSGDQDILLGGVAALSVRRPDRLAGLVGSDIGSFSLWYDGKKVTVHNPIDNVYGVTPLSGDTDTVMAWLETKLGIDIVVRPLLLSDPYTELARTGTTGIHVGQSLVRGVPVEHYAMRSPGVDWEIWVNATGPKLPRRVSVIDRTAAWKSRVIVEFDSWNLSPRLTEAHFAFSPPRGAVQATPVLLGD